MNTHYLDLPDYGRIKVTLEPIDETALAMRVHISKAPPKGKQAAHVIKWLRGILIEASFSGTVFLFLHPPGVEPEPIKTPMTP